MGNTEFKEKIKKVEIEAGKYQLKNGLQEEDVDCFKKIFWANARLYIKHVFVASCLAYYFVGDTDPRMHRFPLEHTLTKTIRKMRFFPNVRHEGIRIVGAIGIMGSYFVHSTIQDALKASVKYKTRLTTPYGEYYRKTLYKVDPDSPYLHKSKLKDFLVESDIDNEIRNQTYLPLTDKELKEVRQKRARDLMKEAKEKQNHRTKENSFF